MMDLEQEEAQESEGEISTHALTGSIVHHIIRTKVVVVLSHV